MKNKTADRLAIENNTFYGGIKRLPDGQMKIAREQLDPLIIEKLKAKIRKTERALLTEAINLIREI